LILEALNGASDGWVNRCNYSAKCII